MAKTTRGALAKSARVFNASKHPRDSKGRFRETADPIKEYGFYTIRPEVRKTLDKLSAKQKKAALAKLGKIKPVLPTPLPKLKDKVTKKDHVTFTDKGIEIWQGSKHKDKDPSFKVRVDKNYNYTVTVDGKEVSLNRNRNVFEFQGEVVRGVPSLHPHLREMSPKDLFRALVSTMTMAESSKPRAPLWDSGLHGQVQGIAKWTYGHKSNKQENYYGEMQVHHVKQWTKFNVAQFNADVRAGKISLSEATKIYDANIFKEKVKSIDKQTGAPIEKDKNSIRVKAVGDREFVMLAAGVHDANSSLFAANHDIRVVDPRHPKLSSVVVGLPEKGKDAVSGSRQWFDTQWKPKFWKEVYRREAYVLREEINRRIGNKSLPLSESKKLWASAHEDALK